MNEISKLESFLKKQIIDVKTYGIKELIRKSFLLVNLLLINLMNLLAIIPCIIIRLISPILIIRIQKITAINFGDFVWLPAMYVCEKKIRKNVPEKNHIDLFYIHYNEKIYNKQIKKMWKRKLNFLPGVLMDPINRVNKMFPGWEKHSIKCFKERNRDIENMFEKYSVLNFTESEEEYGKKTLQKFGLNSNDKFVCLAVRDKAYQYKKISKRFRDWSYHDFRHTDINNFLLAAEELTKKGYYVFRMGVVVEKKFQTKNPKIIDYANSTLRSDFMDVYLGAKCSFCISTGLGFEELPCLFGKPLVQILTPIGEIYTHNKKFLNMTKHHILKKENRELSLSEIFSKGLAWAHSAKIFDEKGVELVDNTPEEIKDLVLEMAEKLSSNNMNNDDEELQKNFKNLFMSNVRISKNKPKESLHGKINSRFSTEFLKKNRNWLS